VSEDFRVHLTGFRAGSLIAGYWLEAPVGAGGMAAVFRARDERLNRLVALKILVPALAADAAFRRRFIAESRAAAAVDDPHIIPIYEAGEADGVLFIAMRFVVAGDLRGVLEREGPLPLDRAAGFLSPVASALDAAHRAGLVHRDVKPANILVDAQEDRPDHVYLSDFGVSKGAVSSVSLTGAGQFLGTPDYSAPEQIQGLSVDGRADQYALACVAYEMLAGVVPFERDQGMAVLLAHLSSPPPSLGSRRPGLPAAADRVLARAMAKAPEKRYGSCRDFADSLREALGLPLYNSRSPASGPCHPQGEIAPPYAGSFRPGVARAGTEAVSADPVAAATLDDTVAAAINEVAAYEAATADPSAPAIREEIIRRPEAGRVTPISRLSRRAGRAVVRRPKATAAIGIAVIGLVIAITIIPSAPRTPGSSGPHVTVRSWVYPTGGEVNSIPVVVDGIVYVGSTNGNFYALDAANGHLRWSYPTGSVESRPAVVGGVVYVGSGDLKVYALDAANGHLRWSYLTGYWVDSGPAVADGVVYVGSDDHKVYALDAANGHLRWSYTTGDFVDSSPAVAGGVVYVGSDDTKVYALDAANGHLRWSYTTGGDIYSSPTAAGGIVYVGSTDGNLYALRAR